MRSHLEKILRLLAIVAFALLACICVLFLASSGGGAALGGTPAGGRLDRMKASDRWAASAPAPEPWWRSVGAIDDKVEP